MTTGSEHVDEAVELRLEPWAHSGEAKLYVTPEHEGQLRELLTAEGVTNSRSTELHEGPILAIVLITVANPAAWNALEPPRTTTLERSRSVAMACYARVHGGAVVGIPRWHAGGQGFNAHVQQAQYFFCSPRSVA